MRYTLATLAFATFTTSALAQQPAPRVTPVTNEQVYAICAEITHKEAGHPVRDCMSSVDTLLARHNVPRE